MVKKFRGDRLHDFDAKTPSQKFVLFASESVLHDKFTDNRRDPMGSAVYQDNFVGPGSKPEPAMKARRLIGVFVTSVSKISFGEVQDAAGHDRPSGFLLCFIGWKKFLQGGLLEVVRFAGDGLSKGEVQPCVG